MLLVTARRDAVISDLTHRELVVLEDLARGFTPKEIAGRRGLSTWTVRFHLSNARRRWNARTNHELVALLARARARNSR